MSIAKRMDKFFLIRERKTDFRTEITAGLATYLSLSYIFVVNPAILANSGIHPSAVLFATVIASGLSTLLMGLWTRLPFALAPGLEMNAFFAFVVVGTLGFTWQQALGTVFWSGILCVVFTIIPARKKIIDSIPAGLKACIATSVGVFVATIGLFVAKILVFKNGLPELQSLSFSSLVTKEAVLMYMGLGLALLLSHKRLRFTGSLLLVIVLCATAAQFLGFTVDKPAEFSTDMFSALFQMDIFSVLTETKFWPVLLTFFIIDFYGSIGKFIGLTASTNLQKKGQLKGIEKAMYADGIGTIGGAVLGTSSIITYVESAIGIAAGGRTGLAAVVCGILMLLSIAFAPLIGLVPVAALSGVLLYVGWLLLPSHDPSQEGFSFGKFDLVVAVLMGLASLLTFSLDKAMLIGFAAYALRFLWNKSIRPNAYLIFTAILLIFAVIAQYMFNG